MYMQPRFGAARKRYENVDLASRIEGASPHALVAILFDELLKSLDAMAAACRRRDFGQRGTRQARALSVLLGLEASLDLSRIDEVEYDDELTTGHQVESGSRVMRIRSHGTAFDFVLTSADASRWQQVLPSKQLGGQAARVG